MQNVTFFIEVLKNKVKLLLQIYGYKIGNICKYVNICKLFNLQQYFLIVAKEMTTLK